MAEEKDIVAGAPGLPSRGSAGTKGITASKEKDFSEWYTQVCTEQGAKLVDIRYNVQGFVVHRPWAFRILRKIYELYEKEVEADGHEPYLFPTVIPEENLLKEKEHAGFSPDVFWVTMAGDEKLEAPLALRPTGETQIYPIYALWIRSYNDLPLKGYQSRITVFRNEKTTRPFLRGREFMFFETHDVFRTHEDAMAQISRDLGMMKRVAWDRLALPFIFFQRPQFDKFKGADNTYAADTLMPDGKRNQMSSTHDLGQRFANAYGLKYDDEDGTEKQPHQTCFGPGIYRHMAALIGIHGDDTGLILPSAVCPLHAVIVPITFSKKPEDAKAVEEFCKKAEKEAAKEFAVKFDSSATTPGFKFNQWEMLGVPVRLEIGPREAKEGKVTIALRAPKEKRTVAFADLNKEIRDSLEKLDSELKARAEKYFANNTKDAKTLKELKDIIEKHRGFVRVPFCSTGMDGEKCADILKTETLGAVVCGTGFENPEKPKKGDKCVVCGKDARHIVYTAKTY
ncbi:MAG TPA: proline--tRNA ligase [Nanoarchaeota archaeon]|nr:proline--tRNA ligase [Nanoarchaeota archaeon]